MVQLCKTNESMEELCFTNQLSYHTVSKNLLKMQADFALMYGIFVDTAGRSEVENGRQDSGKGEADRKTTGC